MKFLTITSTWGLGWIILLLVVLEGLVLEKERIILRLSYRSIPFDKTFKIVKNPYTLGLGETETFTLVPRFMGTDWDGCIYFFDPLKIREDGYVLWVLRRFDKQGRFKEEWEPIPMPICGLLGGGVAVTKDGYIWTSIFNAGCKEHDIPGLPIIVYRKGSKRAVIDWRFRVPLEVKESISEALKEKGLEWRAENLWFHVRPPQEGPRQVALFLVCYDGKQTKKEYVWILLNSEGKQVLNLEVMSTGIRSKIFSPDKSIWRQEPVWNIYEIPWDKLWFWEEGKERGEPLIDRTKNREPWADKIILGGDDSYLYPPIILRDAKGHLYLIWMRDIWKKKEREGAAREEAIKRLTKRFYVGKKIVLEAPPPSIGGECALVVLDRKGKLASYLNWRQVTLEDPVVGWWIRPLPDGSGFYRIEYREREAVVYFHPLPR